MRIVDRKAFLAMPEGTVFAKYKTDFEDIQIKGETVGRNDFYIQLLSPRFVGGAHLGDQMAIEEHMLSGASSPPLDLYVESRDALGDQGWRFAVFERQDVEALIARLGRALEDGYRP